MSSQCTIPYCANPATLTLVFQTKHESCKNFFCDDHTQTAYEFLKTYSPTPGTSLVVRRFNAEEDRRGS